MATRARDIVARYWWMLTIRGVVVLLFGIFTLASPGATVTFAITLFAIFSLIDGVTAIGSGLGERRVGRPWLGWLVQGALGILAGILALAWPSATALVLLYIVGFWAIMGGVGAVGSAVQLRRSGSRHTWIWVLVFGILALLFGLRLLIAPGAGLLGILWFVGTWATIAGVVMIVSSFTLRSAVRR